ncbi:hypothetical protein BJ875DRAFT_284495 [Amylocarpus encephaloides]|uniref:Uncharacterized protein n=1 Tax=Amylocarpus encephaloides TaxID=45428 RepID=A0A9P8C5T1_9HELO|nr:hypothetical protein BJ875DRAFT_284495 [Amylocarpus encephaloides]
MADAVKLTSSTPAEVEKTLEIATKLEKSPKQFETNTSKEFEEKSAQKPEEPKPEEPKPEESKPEKTVPAPKSTEPEIPKEEAPKSAEPEKTLEPTEKPTEPVKSPEKPKEKAPKSTNAADDKKNSDTNAEDKKPDAKNPDVPGSVTSTLVTAIETAVVNAGSSVVKEISTKSAADVKVIGESLQKEVAAETKDGLPSLAEVGESIVDVVETIAEEVVEGVEVVIDEVKAHPELIAEGAVAVGIGIASIVQPELIVGSVAMIGKMAADRAKRTANEIAVEAGNHVVKELSKDLNEELAGHKVEATTTKSSTVKDETTVDEAAGTVTAKKTESTHKETKVVISDENASAEPKSEDTETPKAKEDVPKPGTEERENFSQQTPGATEAATAPIVDTHTHNSLTKAHEKLDAILASGDKSPPEPAEDPNKNLSRRLESLHLKLDTLMLSNAEALTAAATKAEKATETATQEDMKALHDKLDKMHEALRIPSKTDDGLSPVHTKMDAIHEAILASAKTVTPEPVVDTNAETAATLDKLHPKLEAMQASIDKLTQALAARLETEAVAPALVREQPSALLAPESSGLSEEVVTAAETPKDAPPATEADPEASNTGEADEVAIPETTEPALAPASIDTADPTDGDSPAPPKPPAQKHVKRSSFFGGFFG